VIDQLVIVNLRHEARDNVPALLIGLEWHTCLRRILFLNSDDHREMLEMIERDHGAAGVEIFRGQDAYRFLLEVICGLNSPIVAETAVMANSKSSCSLPNSQKPRGEIFFANSRRT
jgi:glutamyl-tRNA reductase